MFLPALLALGLVIGVVASCDGVIRGGGAGDSGLYDAHSPPQDAHIGADASTWDAGGDADASAMPDAQEPDDGQIPVDSALPIDGSSTGVVPPLGGSSGGSGGSVAPSGTSVTASGVSFTLVVPSSYIQTSPNRFMIVYSGTEGEATMVSNLLNVAPMVGLGDVIFAVLDGVDYNGNGAAGATALDYVRDNYNISNDETFLLSESAGTTAGLSLGLDLRQSYFAAYWANDVTASASPSQDAASLGFAPWGNAGPGGNFTDANAIVNGMSTAGYRLPADAPYSGAGASTHGSPEQFISAMEFFNGKSRQ